MKSFLPVLVYQKIGYAPKNSHLKNQWIRANKLDKTLSFLLRRHYTFITPADLQKKLPAKPVLLTFFGGYQSFYTEVFPLLKKYKVCATLLVAADTLGTYNSWQDPFQEPWQNTLTPKQLKEVSQSGWVMVGTLGLSGRNLLACSSPAQAREEILESIHRLHTLHKLDVCSAGFGPWAKDKNLAHTTSIADELHLPVITSAKGTNAPTEKQFLRVMHPGWLTTLRLWINN